MKFAKIWQRQFIKKNNYTSFNREINPLTRTLWYGNEYFFPPILRRKIDLLVWTTDAICFVLARIVSFQSIIEVCVAHASSCNAVWNWMIGLSWNDWEIYLICIHLYLIFDKFLKNESRLKKKENLRLLEILNQQRNVNYRIIKSTQSNGNNLVSVSNSIQIWEWKLLWHSNYLKCLLVEREAQLQRNAFACENFFFFKILCGRHFACKFDTHSS